MFNILYLYFLIVLTSLKISVKCQNDYEALHINRQFPFVTLDMITMKNFKYPKLMYPTALACSAKSNEEDEFNKEQSFGKKSLFVGKIYEGEQTARDIDYHICKNPYQMTVLYHNKNVEFQFGFEVYYDKSEYANEGFTESSRRDYNLITDSEIYINYIRPYIPNLSNVPGLSRVASLPGVSRFFGAQTPLYLDADHERKMGFLWVDSFRMKFNFIAKRVAQTVYGLFLTTRGIIHECDNYDLGKEFFNGLNMEVLYKERNQNRMLEGVKLPTESDDNYKEMACESENQCFTKWLSVPKELFHHLAAKPISCSDLLTVPIWKSTISNVLNKLDNFLFTLSLVIGPPSGILTVHSGVHGVLELPTDSVKRLKKSITLTEKYIPVPDVIYKLVTYKERICKKPKDNDDKNEELNEPGSKHDNENDELKPLKSKLADNDENTNEWKKRDCESATTAIIVVIHNNPYFNPEVDKICEDKCEKWGWGLIKQRKLHGEIITSKYIYCCLANDNNVREKLGIEYEHDTELESVYSNTNFSLKDFPIYDTVTKRYVLGSVYKQVVDTYERLFKDDVFQPDKYNEMNVLMEHYRVRTEYLQIEKPKDDGNGPDKSEVQLDEENGTQNLTDKNADSNDDK